MASGATTNVASQAPHRARSGQRADRLLESRERHGTPRRVAADDGARSPAAGNVAGGVTSHPGVGRCGRRGTRPGSDPSTYGTLGPVRAEEHDDALVDREFRRADDDAAEAAERPPGTRNCNRRPERAFQIALDLERDDGLDRAAIVGPLRVDAPPRGRERSRARRATSSPRSAGTSTVALAQRRSREQRQRHTATSASTRIASCVARSLCAATTQDGFRGAPAGAGSSELRAHAREPLADRAPRVADPSASTIASRATASGVNASCIELGHDPFAGNQIDHRRSCRPSRRAGRAGTSAATSGRRRPSACRAAPPARSPCRTRSAPRRRRRAPCRYRLRRS